MSQKVSLEHIRECDMKLFCYKAKCGDAFHLQYEGESGMCRNIFLDMGYSKTYTQVLKGVISNIIGSSEQIDALFLSHIHDDHIGGASRFIKDIQKIVLWGILLVGGYIIHQESMKLSKPLIIRTGCSVA